MNRIRWMISAPILFTAVVLTSCGGGSNRVLESISLSPNPATAKNGTVQLVATGTFSSAPVTVSPLPVDWSQSPCDDLCDIRPALIGPINVNSEGLATCAVGYSGTASVKAVAPKDPKLAPDTQNVPVITGTASITCQ
jgi:hypothetical protein